MNTQTHKASNSSSEIVRGKFKREKKKMKSLRILLI